MQEVHEMSAQQLLEHHHDDSMPPLDITWEWMQTPGMKHGYWVRDLHREALQILRSADMLTLKEEELPSWAE